MKNNPFKKFLNEADKIIEKYEEEKAMEEKDYENFLTVWGEKSVWIYVWRKVNREIIIFL